MPKLSFLKIERNNPELEALLFVLDQMEDWDYFYILDIKERDWISEKQYAIVRQIYYKYIERYL